MTPILYAAGRFVRKVTAQQVRFRAFRAPHQYSHFSTTNLVQAKRYSRDHEWIDLVQGNPAIGTVGITNFAAKALGDIVYVELPAPGAEVKAGDAIGAVESVKSASDIKAPVEGKIITVNGLLEDQPGLMGTDAENDGEEGGWIAKVEVGEAGMAEVDKLMGEEEYQAFVLEEEQDK